MMMSRTDLAADMKRFCDGGGFITRKKLADYMGIKDPRAVARYLHGLVAIDGRYYYIQDVANELIQKGTIK